MKNYLIIHHKEDHDGYGSGALVHDALLSSDITIVMHPTTYGESAPLSKLTPDTITYILDFSYDGPTLNAIATKCAQVIVIDHHQSAIDRLTEPLLPNIELILDTSHCAMWLTNVYLRDKGLVSPDTEDWLVDYIDDHDRYVHELPFSKEVGAFLSSLKMQDYAQYNNISFIYEDPRIQYPKHTALVTCGAAVLSYAKQRVAQTIERAKTKITFAGYENIPTVNSTIYESAIGNELSRTAPFAIVWFVTPDLKSVKLSLRSNTDNSEHVAVNTICEQFGGGGHKHAAGCTLTLAQWTKILTDNLYQSSGHESYNVTYGKAPADDPTNKIADNILGLGNNENEPV